MNRYLSLQKVSFSFGQGKQVFFDDISLNVEAPGLIFVVGKNGVGKSTFLRLLQGIIHGSEEVSGVIYIQNKPYDLANVQDRAKLYDS